MKKFFIRLTIIVFIMFVSFEIVYAYSFSSYGDLFAGRIIQTKATEIEEMENSGFSCTEDGTSITINSIKGPETYIIPDGTYSKTGKDISEGDLIMGRYSDTTPISCQKTEGETTIIETVDLNTITLFGNS